MIIAVMGLFLHSFKIIFQMPTGATGSAAKAAAFHHFVAVFLKLPAYPAKYSNALWHNGVVFSDSAGLKFALYLYPAVFH